MANQISIKSSNCKNSKSYIVLKVHKNLLKWIMLTVAIIIIVVCLYFYWKKQGEWKQTRYKLHKASTRCLLHQKRKKPNLNLSEAESRRTRAAIHLLLNKKFDDEVLIVRCQVVKSGSHWPAIDLRYLDEKLKVAYIKYIDTKLQNGEQGFMVIGPNEMPPIDLRMWGTTDLLVPLREDANLPTSAPPFQSMKHERAFYVLPKPLFKSIVEGCGEFALLDKDKNVLDALTVQEVSFPRPNSSKTK